MRKKITVGCSPLSGTIYAGTLLKGAKLWSTNRDDVTTECLMAVAEHVLHFGKPVKLTGKGLPTITITVTKEK